MTKFLVTGASGFVGGAIVARLAADKGSVVRVAVRRNVPIPFEGVEQVSGIDLDAVTDWHKALSGVSQVVHAAARVHVMVDSALDPLSEYRRVNVDGTLNLALQAAKLGVRRFVFISSIKVNGEVTGIGKPFCADDVPNPVDPYGRSKYEAELGLMEVAASTGLEVVIIRPVLVYGPGVKANFQSMMNWVDMRLLKKLVGLVG